MYLSIRGFVRDAQCCLKKNWRELAARQKAGNCVLEIRGSSIWWSRPQKVNRQMLRICVYAQPLIFPRELTG